MWEVDLPQTAKLFAGNQSKPTLTNAHQQPNIHCVFLLSTTSSAILYLHAAALFPVKSTWLKEIKNNFFSSWPFLTYAAVNKYLTPQVITSQAHMQQEQQNIRSTKTVANRIARCNYQPDEEELISKEPEILLLPDEIQDDFHPPLATKSKEIIFKIEQTSKVYSDQTGKFPFPFSHGY